MSQNNDMISVAESLIGRIETILTEKEYLILALDGRCASGKTTLTAFLQEKLSCAVIHMDDFFLRPEQRTKERLAVPGGNVDYERFLKEILIPLKNQKDFTYRPYDCHTQMLKEAVAVNRNRITIVEGTYSCHPALWEYYDLHVFLDVDKERQMERICLRNGEVAASRFANLWIPLEEKYITECDIEKKCEICYHIKIESESNYESTE